MNQLFAPDEANMILGFKIAPIYGMSSFGILIHMAIFYELDLLYAL